MEAADHERLVERLQRQAQTAEELGSTLYAMLFARVADDVADHGLFADLLAPFAHEPDGNALPLRLGAAVHRLVLRRRAPALAMYYPSVGGTAGPDGLWAMFRSTVEEHRDVLQELIAMPCQTNEVGRSAALAPGFLLLAARHELPLHHLEIGTSAGLNLRWDRFAYGVDAAAPAAWGPQASPVDLRGHWQTAPPPRVLAAGVDVVGRAGCDPRPLDVTTPEGRETLTASVWPDQVERHERLKGALELAAQVPATVEAAPAGEWLEGALADRPDEALTIVSHSVVWRYIPTAEQNRIVALLERHGAAATPDRPLAWVRLEPRPPMTTYSGVPYPVTVTTWPGGERLEVAEAKAHGQDVRWLLDAGPLDSAR